MGTQLLYTPYLLHTQYTTHHFSTSYLSDVRGFK